MLLTIYLQVPYFLILTLSGNVIYSGIFKYYYYYFTTAGAGITVEQHMHSHVQAFIGVSEHFEKLYTKI